MNEVSEKNDANLWLKSGLGVGAISVGGYLLGFAYELGYASYFGIPVQLIKLNLISIFLSITGLFALLWFLFSIINVGYTFFSQRQAVIFRGIVRSAPSILFFAAAFYVYKGTFSYLKWLIFLPALYLFGEFVLPLITQRGKGTYYQKLGAQEETSKKFQEPKTIFDFIAQKKSGLNLSRLIRAIIIFVILYLFASWIGLVEAQRQKNFLVIREPKPLVVLRIYGDKFVCAPFDSKAGTVEKALYILDTPSPHGLWLDWQQVGPLKPVDKKMAEPCNVGK